MGKEITLEVHHVDGNNKNNDQSNLQVLCLNCHGKTHNYRAKNIKTKIK
jgi:predicted HNH restriction endonuclease